MDFSVHKKEKKKNCEIITAVSGKILPFYFQPAPPLNFWNSAHILLFNITPHHPHSHLFCTLRRWKEGNGAACLRTELVSCVLGVLQGKVK
jgi:hypothetical protein